jgi:hypothetical protein
LIFYNIGSKFYSIALKEVAKKGGGMKKIILSVCFIVIILSLSLPAFADSFWNYSSTVNAKGIPMKVTATLTRDVPGGALTMKYKPDHLVFHMSNTDVSVNSLVDTDIEILDSTNNMSITGSMHGGALQVKNTYTVTASFDPANEADHPFNFTDASSLLSMTVEPIPSATGLITSVAEGTLTEIYKNGIDTGSAKINMTFSFVGIIIETSQPALITVTLSGTLTKTP